MQQYSGFAYLYDLFMDGVDYDAWAKYLASFIPASARVLECGCGTGEITLRLKKMGFDITASDISPDMLAVASEKARHCGLRIPFLQTDMRCLSFPKRFDAVIAPCDCVNYLTSLNDAERFCSSAYSVLKDGGRLIFDISSRYKLEKVLGFNTFSDIREEACYIWKNNYDCESKLIEMQLEFFKLESRQNGDKALYERFSERHVQRAHSERELRFRLERVGFSDIRVFAGITENEPDSGSERLHFVAKKQ